MNLMIGMAIPALSDLVAGCWARAELALRNTVRERFPDRNEEIITELFHAELETEFNTVSANGLVEQAFEIDLWSYLPNASQIDLSNISRGLVASVHFHPREIEKRTGGDFGVVLVRPVVRRSFSSEFEVEIDCDYRCALLCQAKMFRRSSRWGRIGQKQQEILKDRLKYLSLVLYRHADQKKERRDLLPVRWQLTHDATLTEMNNWLRNDRFPSPQESQEIIRALAQGLIGTDDKETIDEYIAPPLRPSLEISIRWRDFSPGTTVQLRETAMRLEQHVQVRQ
jgi:hypothetical protein